jgi:hypothetical protein
MALTDATFSGYVSTLLAKTAITDAFPVIRRRQVNVLREERFPLLAAWVEGDDESADGGSDGEIQYEPVYTVLVAAKLQANQAQDVILGQLIKVVKDAIDAMGVAGVEFKAGRWDADNNAAEGDGDKVWAAFPVTFKLYRLRGNY